MNPRDLLEAYVPTGRRLGREFFEQPSVDVAKGLLGRFLVREFPSDGTYVCGLIKEVAAYEGETDHSAEGLLGEAGIIDISQRYAQFLLDIATGRNGKASCVTLRGALFSFVDSIVEAKGPGKLTETISIDKNFSGQDIVTGREIWVEGEAVPDELKRRRNLSTYSDNCLGYWYIR